MKHQVEPGKQWPAVGLGVFVFKDGKVLFGRRLTPHGKDSWCPPGGKLEMNESWEAGLKRETLEEAGIKIKNITFVGPTNDIFTETGLHYITLYFRADWASGEPTTNEPDKIVDWQWVSLDKLPEPLFVPTKNFFDSPFSQLLR